MASSSSSLYSSSSSIPGPSTNHPTSSTKTITTSKSHSKPSNKNSSSSKLNRGKSKVQVFTKEMQDAQARGKDPYQGRAVVNSKGDESESESEDDGKDRYGEPLWGIAGRFEREPYERKCKMEGAAFAMDNPEVILMQSLERGESIPNTRNFFRKMMCGFFDPNDPNDGMMDEPPGEEKERRELKAKPQPREWDRQGRDWGSGYVNYGSN